MAGYLSTTKTFNHKCYGVYSEYKKVWYNFEFKITVSVDGSISYTITSTNNVSEIKGWNGCQTSAWIKIAGTEVLDTGYYGGNGFPWGNGTTKSGTLSTTSKSITIQTKLIPGSSYSGWPEEWDDSLKTTTLTRAAWTDVTVGTVDEIKDNYDNSYTVKGTRGAAGTNNDVNGALLYWTHAKKSDGSWSYSKASNSEAFGSGKTTHSKTISFTPSGTAATRTVAGAVVTDGERNDTDTGWKTGTIRQYIDPGHPGTPTLAASSLKNGRLTIKQNWSYTWTAAAQGNSSCPVVGYRIRLYKNGSLITGFRTGTGNTIVKDNTLANEYLDRDSTSCTVTFNPVDFDYAPGDKVKLGIYAYTRYGKTNNGSQRFNGSGAGDSQQNSAEHTVQNAGIMRVKVGGAWKEGQVYVKVNGSWKEADVIKTKVNGAWTESS